MLHCFGDAVDYVGVELIVLRRLLLLNLLSKFINFKLAYLCPLEQLRVVGFANKSVIFEFVILKNHVCFEHPTFEEEHLKASSLFVELVDFFLSLTLSGRS